MKMGSIHFQSRKKKTHHVSAFNGRSASLLCCFNTGKQKSRIFLSWYFLNISTVFFLFSHRSARGRAPPKRCPDNENTSLYSGLRTRVQPARGLKRRRELHAHKFMFLFFFVVFWCGVWKNTWKKKTKCLETGRFDTLYLPKSHSSQR